MPILEKTQKMVDQVKKQMQETGASAANACKKLGIRPGRYYGAISQINRGKGLTRGYNKRRVQTQAKGVTVTDIPVANDRTTERLIVAMGSPRDVSAFLRNYQ